MKSRWRASLYPTEKIVIICGHYGTGKTNFTLNLAHDLAQGGQPVTVSDMDIVNPYFRSSDYKNLLNAWDVSLVAPRFARSNVDLPALPPEMFSLFERNGTILIDAGGDDAGATALGRLAGQLAKTPYEMYYVINPYRPLTGAPGEAAALLREIEAASRLKATALVSNAHLKELTTADTIVKALPFARETAALLNLPLAAVTAPRALEAALSGRVENLYPVDIFVTTPWQGD